VVFSHFRGKTPLAPRFRRMREQAKKNALADYSEQGGVKVGEVV